MRLDQLLVERGLFESRERARRAVMAGLVEVEGRRV
ncbi:MAG TPA: S4 domain-containing protein, partial [Thermoanaerobaculia bacterium]|nr:S4 domain-containing protein [Thermoanaerobaculia bacterium]